MATGGSGRPEGSVGEGRARLNSSWVAANEHGQACGGKEWNLTGVSVAKGDAEAA